MALMDYQKLCPKSGHALTRDEQEALRAKERTTSQTRTIRCETCGRTLNVCLYPGTGRPLVYPMHLRSSAEARLDSSDRPANTWQEARARIREQEPGAGLVTVPVELSGVLMVDVKLKSEREFADLRSACELNEDQIHDDHGPLGQGAKGQSCM